MFKYTNTFGNTYFDYNICEHLGAVENNKAFHDAFYDVLCSDSTLRSIDLVKFRMQYVINMRETDHVGVPFVELVLLLYAKCPIYTAM